MSDAEGGSGAVDPGTANDAVSWEARLDAARKQRAKILAKAADSNKASREKKDPQESLFKRPAKTVSDSKLEAFLTKQPSPSNDPEPNEKKRRLSLGLVVLMALLCGTVLGWGLSKMTSGLQQAHAMPVQSDPEIAQLPPRQQLKSPVIGIEPVNLVYDPELLSQPETYVWGQNTLFDPPNPPSLPKLIYEDVAVFDPIPQDPAPSPRIIDKPVEASKSVEAIEVSLFVPARVSSDASNKAVDALADGQAKVVAVARVGFSVKNTQVRYYHLADADKAKLAARALDGTSRDFTNSRSKTRPGHIEVYLAGSGSGSQKNRNAQKKPTEFDLFIARILDELQ